MNDNKVKIEINDQKVEFNNVNLSLLKKTTYEIVSFTSTGSPRDIQILNKFLCKSMKINLNDSFIVPQNIDGLVNKVIFEANLKSALNENIKIDSIGELFSSEKLLIKVYDGNIEVDRDYSLEFDFIGDYILIIIQFDNAIASKLSVKYNYIDNSIILMIHIIV